MSWINLYRSIAQKNHLFCNKCIQKHLETESSCPLCFTSLDKSSFQLSKFAQRQISRLRVSCPYYTNGCSWQGLIADCHVEKCGYAPMVCPNTTSGCTESMLSSVNIKQHIEQCPYQQLTCPNNMPLCQPFLRKDLKIHENECQSYPCPYAHEGCPFISTANKVRIHCDGYCGRLHKSIDDLTNEVKRLNKIIEDASLGVQIKMPSTPDNLVQENSVKMEEDKDTSMNEMALFHEMFNSNLFGSLDLNNTVQNTDYLMTSPPTQPPEQEQPVANMMDLSSLDFLNTLSTDSFKMNRNPTDAPSPQPLEFIPPKTVPKRTTNGKKIRYSKNVRLAHSALRMARERTASAATSDDTILDNLNVSKEKSNQLVFKHTTNVNKLIKNDEAKPKKEKRKASINTKSAESPKHDPPAVSPSSQPNGSGPKRRPMFILASSYLTNYSANNQ
ncbi:unnamed protein product [Rhizopus stolonifer]